VRNVTIAAIRNLDQLRTEVIRAVENARREKAWGARVVHFGRRGFLRDLKHERTVEHRDLALIGLPGSGKSTLATVFRDAPVQGHRVWFDLLRDRLADGQPTIVVLDDIRPGHIDSLRPLYARLAPAANASFLITSRFPEVPGLLAGRPAAIVPRPVPALDPQPGLELLAWLVAVQIGKTSRDARPDLNLLRDALRSLARHADGFPAMLEILSGLVVRQGHSIKALRRCADDIERELAEVRSGLERELGPGEELHASIRYRAGLERLLGHWLTPDGLLGPARDLLGLCTILPPMPFSYSETMLQLHWRAACAADINGWGADRDRVPRLYDLTGRDSTRERALRLQVAGLRAKQLLQDAVQPAGRESRCEEAGDDEGNEAWLLFEIADLHASAGKLAEAEEFCRQAGSLERDRVRRARRRREDEHVLEELLGNIARVRADIAQSRGDLAEESRQRARAVMRAYAFQVRPPQALPCQDTPGRYEGGPDEYTDAYCRECPTGPPRASRT
jgi:hypothetical protein